MIKVEKRGVLLSKRNLGFECESVLNPAVIKDGSSIHLFYRAVAKGNYSTIGYCKLSSPLTIEERNDIPLLFPQFDFENQGVEDPRIVKIENLFYLTYTAYDGVNALGALATSVDLIHWKKHGIIVPQIIFSDFIHYAESKCSLNEKYVRFNRNQKHHTVDDSYLYIPDKNLIFFPRKINDKLCFLHRIKPDIQVVTSIDKMEDLTPEFWQNYFLQFGKSIVLSPIYEHEVSYIGGGCPPIETSEGWLLIYHGVRDTINGYVYSACAALLDLSDPQKEIARLPYPLFFPEERWELQGEVNNVCFPTGAIVEEDILYIYYGAADERIAVASVSFPMLIEELLSYKK